ncbi:hypothetical protein P5673_021516 [Acropora cervicornis]|uniref:Uncharacterized protein n=1 Tax=Acropora cervicornis TaxID=6130 RepID=A0AAD9Q8C6_ACRCE|nr:hypothetical protein P5673_021516 [Acropora cervicornis]
MVTSKCRQRTQLKTLVERCNSSQFGLALQDNSDSTGEGEIIPRTSSQDVGSIVVERKQN